MTVSLVRRGLTGVSILGLAMAAGCTSNEDRSRTEKASLDNVKLSAEVNALRGEHQTMKESLEAAQKERDLFKGQAADAKAMADANDQLKKRLLEATQQSDAAKASLKAADERLAKTTGELIEATITADKGKAALAKATADLDAAKKGQADAEQMATKLKASEDAVAAARAKANEAEKAAATSADAATKAKEQVAALTTEKAALQAKVDALTAELAKKAPAGGKEDPAKKAPK